MKYFHSYTYRVANGFGDFASLSCFGQRIRRRGREGINATNTCGVDGTAKLSETLQLYRRLKSLIISIDNYTNAGQDYHGR